MNHRVFRKVAEKWKGALPGALVLCNVLMYLCTHVLMHLGTYALGYFTVWAFFFPSFSFSFSSFLPPTLCLWLVSLP